MSAQKVKPEVGINDQAIDRAARMLFDKANPDTLITSDLDRDRWFGDTRDYWMRAVRELAEQLGTPMVVTCPCGWTSSGPAKDVRHLAFFHKCEKSDPYWGKRSTGDGYGH